MSELAALPFRLVDRHRTTSPTSALPPSATYLADASRPEHYIVDEPLENAANTAIALGQPLLLTGDPGTGKTRFADYLAWQLGLDKPFEFHTKSASVASDLFYSHDTVRRFHVAHLGIANVAELDFVRFNALGEAIVRSLGDRALKFGLTVEEGAIPSRSVVLIDEIDKAPRDFPNDLLHELPRMCFRIAELNLTIDGDPAFRPIVVVTSNRERPLPDAFLRRCVFHNIELPNVERMAQILCARFGYTGPGTPALVDSVARLFEAMRQKLVRPPSPAEVVAWFHLFRSTEPNTALSVQKQAGKALRFASALVKSRDDMLTLHTLLQATSA
jgi:MoxR-like ATPase